MQRGKQIQIQQSGKPAGDRHSMTRQVLDSFVNAVRQSSEIQNRLSDYR